MNSLTRFSSASVLAGLIASPAFAVSVDVPANNVFGNETGHLRLGLAAMSTNSVYDNYDEGARPVPLVFYSGEKFYWMGPQGGFNFISSENHQLSAILEFAPDFWERSELQNKHTSPIANRDDSDRSFNVGFQYLYKSDCGVLRLKAATDISDSHEGGYYELGYSYPFQLGEKLSIVPGVSVTQFDEDYTAYYFADNPDQGTGNEATRMSFKLGVTYELNDNWQLLAGAAVSKLDDVDDGQVILNDDKESNFYIGFTYKVF
ncbi:hypothetical protein A9Q89_02350 [Gammaproteobacteria bacterium 53_120_T64]|nr:hypothetical protein A9Q89_02350 [Gammaproteobacteria bacterium 53_120_T64]